MPHPPSYVTDVNKVTDVPPSIQQLEVKPEASTAPSPPPTSTPPYVPKMPKFVKDPTNSPVDPNTAFAQGANAERQLPDGKKSLGFLVSGMYGKPHGEIRPLSNSTTLPVYKYVLLNQQQQEQCEAGTIDHLMCDANHRCTGKLYNHDRYGCADPDAIVTLEMEKPEKGTAYSGVKTMTVRHNTSGRNLDALVRDNKDMLKLPSLTIPGHSDTINKMEALCASPGYCDGYRLKNTGSPNTIAYVTGVTCEDQHNSRKGTCSGKVTITGEQKPTFQIKLHMERYSEPKHANTCHQDMYSGLDSVELERL